ncbi:hypothetical protein M0R88_04120 [Halorussus gelatinilyticus]|uniref:FkbM family methyltransferase n=1 Tax=Halorussus gelatinilyticus TaxID=2937524 RepID=A0A8U0IKV0_9EURY|nr:hypothetical protein [Halorussus gelatinilyticus]UPW01295.1 hypothetical protein M0R88_04120 [Halorussus gelatinilyticus]
MKDTLYTAIRQTYYRHLRPRLPRKIGVYNGYPARKPKLFDRVDVDPDWEAPFIESIQDVVAEGDTVVVVGGGFGISTVAAATKSGPDGRVISYEASKSRYKCAQETIELNGVSGRVTLKHALVGPDIAVKGDLGGASAVTPSNLPDCDVLALDCEGAELDIIERLGPTPREIVVESHGCFDAPTQAVRETLEQNEFTVINELEDNPKCGIDILTAASK